MAITLRTTLGVDLDLGKGAAEAFLALSSAYPSTPSQVLAIPFMRSATSPERLAAMVADAEALQKGGRPLTALAEAVLGDIVTFGTAALVAAGHPLQASAPLRKGEAGELRTVLAAHMHRAYTVYLDELTIAGKLSREERMEAGSIVGKALEVLEQEFDTELGRRAVVGGELEKADWKETEHPRDATGEFTGGPSGGQGVGGPAEGKEKPSPTGGLGTADRKRLKELGVKKYPPPTASDIVVHPDADPKTQALVSWRDSKGRIQSAYAAQFHERNAAGKWKRVQKYRPQRDAVRQKATAALERHEPGTTPHDSALIVGIIAHTGLRPGNPKSAGAEHYGITTLKPEHVTFTDEGAAQLSFVGKSGHHNKVTISDPQLSTALRQTVDRAKAGGKGQIFGATADDARGTLPSGMKLKDLRTIKATETAEQELAKAPPPPVPEGKKERDRLIATRIKQASQAVADTIQNTPAVAKSSYIHPDVFEAWRARNGL